MIPFGQYIAFVRTNNNKINRTRLYYSVYNFLAKIVIKSRFKSAI